MKTSSLIWAIFAVLTAAVILLLTAILYRTGSFETVETPATTTTATTVSAADCAENRFAYEPGDCPITGTVETRPSFADDMEDIWSDFIEETEQNIAAMDEGLDLMLAGLTGDYSYIEPRSTTASTITAFNRLPKAVGQNAIDCDRDWPNEDQAAIRMLQAKLGIETSGGWGPRTSNALRNYCDG